MIFSPAPHEQEISQHQQAALDYERIEKAIRFIGNNFTRQPDLKEIADTVHLSEFHFERMFSRWAGTTPQRFLRYLTKEYAVQLLEQSRDLADVSYEVGLSGTGRLHDLFVTYEAMSPGEYKQKGRGLEIFYGFHLTPFGACLVALTARGICGLTFYQPDQQEQALRELHNNWPDAKMTQNAMLTVPVVAQLFASDQKNSGKPLHLLLKGTNFQIKVWEALLKIPSGHAVSYESIARTIGNPKAVRAVGTACGSNSIALLIPCHRVLQKAGAPGGYRWGIDRKKALLAWEAAQVTTGK